MAFDDDTGLRPAGDGTWEGAVVGVLSEEEITENNLMEMLAHGEGSGDGVQENGECADG